MFRFREQTEDRYCQRPAVGSQNQKRGRKSFFDLFLFPFIPFRIQSTKEPIHAPPFQYLICWIARPDPVHYVLLIKKAILTRQPELAAITFRPP